MKRVSSFLILSILIFWGCANQLPPGGGPVDREAPQIIRTFPENGTLNYNKNFVEFEFNEYVNKRLVANSIFISPYFNEEIEQKWSGKKLRLIFPEKLKENKTYVISLGTDISDLRGNKLNETFTLTFSTGSKIDQGIISGRVYDSKSDGIMIFFYLIDSLNKLVDYSKTKPDFVSQTSKDGSFILTGLPEGIFRIIAVRDQMKNLLFDLNEDEIGLPFRDYEITDTLRIIRNVQFEMMKIDTIKPVLNSVKFVDLNHLILNFNEPVDLNTINPRNIFIYDSTGIENLNPAGFYSLEKNSLMLVTPKLHSEKDYIISLKGIRDLDGNEIDSTIQTFYTEMISDTIPIMIKMIQGNFSSSYLEYFNPEIELSFNDLIYFNDFLSSFSVSDTLGKKLNFSVSRKDSASFFVRLEPLKQKDKILIKINLSSLTDLAGNRLDTVFIKTFDTNSDADYGLISGNLINKIRKDEKLLVEAKSLSSNKTYRVETKEDKYQIKNVLPGNYFLKVSLQRDDSKNDFRNFTIPFTYHQDTIKVKSRWPTTDVNFNVEGLFR